MSNGQRPRIAILGGGAGAIAAALQLSKPGWEDHFESITVYQQGWRLGGKCASGRGADRRIEEHGLHVWLGFYENSFRLLDRCHRELDERAAAPDGETRWPLAFQSVEESFSRLDTVGVADHDGCEWKLWLADFIDDEDDRPWYEHDPRPAGERPHEWTVSFYLVRCLWLAADAAQSLAQSDSRTATLGGYSGGAGITDLQGAVSVVLSALGGDVRTLLGASADLVDALAQKTFERPLVLDALDVLARALDAVVDFVRRRADDLVRAEDSVRRAYYLVDLMVAIARGLIEDGVLEENSFDVVDDVDLRDWLLGHGATRESVDCALIRAIVYDLGFAYEGGDPMRPACAAGTALRGLLRAFLTYRGSVMWKMNSGMGDVVFLPFYELLCKRGVEVRFFHRIEAVRAADGQVEEIEIDVQAEPPPAAQATQPDPEEFLALGGNPASLAWPAEPKTVLQWVDQHAKPETYESWYAGREAARVRTVTLKRGGSAVDAEDRFDLVVFGLPIGCVPHVASSLTAQSQRWREAVDQIKTVPTQALQLWLTHSVEDLVDAVDPGTVLSGFIEPFDTWADMPQLVAQENVGGSRTVAYFCNALPDSAPPARGGDWEGWLEERKKLVEAQAVRFLTRDIDAIWPKAVDPASRKFKWDLLVGGLAGADEPLGKQYKRANVEPSERYVQSVPGSSGYRIPPGDSGFENLYLAGDWTACGINAGCVEAAVISGMQAANAIHAAHGDPAQVEPPIGLESP